MRRRLYVVVPDLASAIQTANDLLLARVEDRHMHFLGPRGTSLGQLHEASFLQKSDLRHHWRVTARHLPQTDPDRRFHVRHRHDSAVRGRRRDVRQLGVNADRTVGTQSASAAVREGNRCRSHPADGRCTHRARRGNQAVDRTTASRSSRSRDRSGDPGLSVALPSSPQACCGVSKAWRSARASSNA
jgi:hypothetical protein